MCITIAGETAWMKLGGGGDQGHPKISKNSSEGFSPLFLLLGATGSASGMLNMYVFHVVGSAPILTSFQDCHAVGSP